MNNKNIVIIDSDIGNVGSLKRAVDHFGYNAVISKNFKEISKASHLILPGVGSFDEGMKKIKENQISEILNEMVKINQIPLLGICLGMQLLASAGFENNKKTQGLNLIPGTVKKIEITGNFKLPHIGWNEVFFKKNNIIFNNIPNNSDFYFIHSYKFMCEDKLNEIAISNFCENFTSAVIKNNIYGVQFHPEKSLKLGIELIKNFLGI